MVRIFAMKVTEQDFEENKWRPYLSKARCEAAARRKNVQDRQLFLGAEVLLNRGLEQVCRGVKLPAAYEKNEHGKPYLLPPNKNIYVNWTHSGEYALCAVAGREVGVDLQYNRKEPGEKLVRKLLGTSEMDFYKRQMPERKRILFYEYWTVKESCLKAMGTGFRTPLEHFSVEMGSGAPRIVQNISNGAQPKVYTCCLLDFADKDYTAAICTAGPDDLEKLKIEYLS